MFGKCFSSLFAHRCIRAMSALNCAAIWGRRILTATSVPSRSVALCTWATLALPRGLGSMYEKSVSAGLENSCSITEVTVSMGSGGISSRSFANSSENAGVTRSGRKESICPSLMYAPPSSSKAARMRAGRSWGTCVLVRCKKGSVYESPILTRIPESPCFESTRATWPSRSSCSFIFPLFY